MSYKSDIPDDGFQITDELVIRDLLESEASWRYQFDKAGKYDYDLVVTHWPETAREPSDAAEVGFVEVERARKSWDTGTIPDHWGFYSFLRRKVHNYDHTRQAWTGLKTNGEAAVYLKFNKQMDNCFIAPITAVDSDGVPTVKSDGSYADSYLKLPLSHSKVKTGLDDATEQLQEFFTGGAD
jgi:hypothetical protein